MKRLDKGDADRARQQLAVLAAALERGRKGAGKLPLKMFIGLWAP